MGTMPKSAARPTHRGKNAGLACASMSRPSSAPDPKSAIQGKIEPDQTFCLDSDGAACMLEAAEQGRKTLTNIGLYHGRLRFDLAHSTPSATQPATQPVQIEESGLEHEATIRSPTLHWRLRGTKVSLFEQEAFDPEAMSLTGRALYLNTLGHTVPFGSRRPTVIRGAQTSAVQQALIRSTPSSLSTFRRPTSKHARSPL